MGKCLEQAAYRPEALLRRGGGVCEADELGNARGRDRSDVVALEGSGDASLGLFGGVFLADARDLLDDLQHGPERDALAVGKAAAGEDGGVVADRAQRLRDEPRLPDAGVAEHGEEVARALAHGAGKRIPQKRELAIPAHHVRIEAPRMRGSPGHHLEQPVRHHAIALAFHDQGLERLGANRVSREHEGLLPDEDLAGRRRALEPLRHDYDVTADERVVARRIAGDHFPAVHALANLDMSAMRALELDVQPFDRLAEVSGRPHRAQGVVLVQHGHTEDGHDRVADELLDPPAVPLESRTRLVVVRHHHATETLGILAVA